jgi:HlyD family secretion protein
MDIPIDSNGGGVATPSLRERVKDLQLDTAINASKKGSGGGFSWLPWLLCTFLALSWAGVGIKSYKQKATDPGALPAGVKLEPVTSSSSGSTNTSSSGGSAGSTNTNEVVLQRKGYLIPAHQISISPIDVSGRIVKLFVEEGKQFKKDEILAELDSTPFQAELLEAKANMLAAQARLDEANSGNRPEEIRQAEAELAEARALLRQNDLEWQRSKSLLSSTSLAQKEAEQAEAAFRTSEQKVRRLTEGLSLMKQGPRDEKKAALKAEFEAAQQRFFRNQWRVQNCSIKAPVTGIILSKKAELGSLINPVVGGVSTSLCEMADLSDIEVDLEIDERDIAKVKLGQHCRVKADAYSDREYVGFVDRTMPTAIRARGTHPVRIKVLLKDGEEQGRYLKPEMGVTVDFFNRESATELWATKKKEYINKGASLPTWPKVDPAPKSAPTPESDPISKTK